MSNALRCFFLLFGLAGPLAAFAASPLIPAPPALSAPSYALIEQETGQVLAQQNAHDRNPPASLTKLMTGYILAGQLASGAVRADEKVKISSRAWAQNPLFAGSSRMFIEVGKEVSIEDLHRGLVVSSGNDASMAIAEHLADSEENFVELMNREAQRLGMDNSHFSNSHGLPTVEHYTTAYDIATLSRALIRNYPEAYALYAEKEFEYNGIRQKNRNRLLWDMENADGIKTGYTESSGYSLAASAVSEGMRLVAVVFGAQSEWARMRDARRLLNYGFRYYTLARPALVGASFGNARVWGGKEKTLPAVSGRDILLALPRNWRSSLQREVRLREDLRAPVAAGEPLGMLRLSMDGELILEEPLLAARAVEALPWWRRWVDLGLQRLSSWWKANV